jgi:choline dehydrogenase
MAARVLSMETIQADILIIGGGSAGCALAARLSADPRRQVVLLEAGPDDCSTLRRVMAGKFQMTGDRRFDWHYMTEPDPNMANRPRVWPRGKALGGSSTINGLIAIRGQREDYDSWAAMGCSGWGWGDVLPYFRRLEHCVAGASELHNVGGPLPVLVPRGRHFLCDQFVAAAREIWGVGENRDFNGASQEGAGYYPMNLRRGAIPLRASASSAYLKEARRRPNLRVISDAHVHRVTFDGKRASGVVFDRGGARVQALARRAVILSAGAIGSPQLLQLSGIGEPEHLRSLGISVVVPIGAVGQNLQDHLQLPSRFRSAAHTLSQRAQNVYRRVLMAVQGMMMQTSVYYGAVNFGMFVRTDPKLTRPDVQFHVHPAAGSLRSRDRLSVMSISGWQLRPTSRGRITIRSTDPLAAPAIFANYLSTEIDQRVAVATFRIARRLAESEALRPFKVEPLQPGAGVGSDAEMLDFARQMGETTYHPVGTCRMGADADSVVDARLRVRGVRGLYVADASIMPALISGNTNLPAVMIGEKAADIIIEDERVEFG